MEENEEFVRKRIGKFGEIYDPTITQSIHIDYGADAREIKTILTQKQQLPERKDDKRKSFTEEMENADYAEYHLMKIFETRTKRDLIEIGKRMRKSYSKDLVTCLKKFLIHKCYFKDLLIACSTKSYVYSTVVLSKAIHKLIQKREAPVKNQPKKAKKKISPEMKIIINILCTAKASEMSLFVEYYEDYNYTTLYDDLQKVVRQSFLRKLLTALIRNDRVEPTDDQMIEANKGNIRVLFDIHRANTMVTKLLKSSNYNGKNMHICREFRIVEMLSKETVWQIAAVNQSFFRSHNKNLLDFVTTSFKGKFSRAVKLCIMNALDGPAAFAEMIKDAFDAPIDYSTLIWIFSIRPYIDMKQIKDAYTNRYNHSISRSLQKIGSFKMRKLVRILCKE